MNVWIKLYMGEDDLHPSVFKVKPIPDDIHDLKEAVHTKAKLVCRDFDLEIYAQGTPVPMAEGTRALGPGDQVPRKSTSQEPLIVVAPPPAAAANQQGLVMSVNDSKRLAEEIFDRMETKRRRLEGKRPRRLLSYISKSHAFSHVQREQRVQFGCDFFFPLFDLSSCSFECTAFAEDGPDGNENENTVHHPYFIRQIKLLVDAALEANIPLAQQIFWSKSGKWMNLDDGHSTGVEPDFCMTAIVDKRKLTPIQSEGLLPPQSKYDVSVALEMKKAFVAADQIEALDYGERLLCVQRGRKCVYTALFHCCNTEKTIRWLKTEESNGHFFTSVSRPASLAPGEAGQQQLLTVLTKSSAELGLDFPQFVAPETNELVKVTSLVGEGATSTVYAATFQGREGILKRLKDGFRHLANYEDAVLKHLRQNLDMGIPSHVTIICDGALFFAETLTHVDALDREKLATLIDCLRAAHQADTVHCDIRPDNIMQDVEGNVFLIDWGFAYCKKFFTARTRSFRGTFRYASDEVLEKAIAGLPRMPHPKDDLESLVRVVLAQRSPSLQDEIAQLPPDDLHAARAFWAAKRNANPRFEWAFELASVCDYNGLKAVMFG